MWKGCWCKYNRIRDHYWHLILEYSVLGVQCYIRHVPNQNTMHTPFNQLLLVLLLLLSTLNRSSTRCEYFQVRLSVQAAWSLHLAGTSFCRSLLIHQEGLYAYEIRSMHVCLRTPKTNYCQTTKWTTSTSNGCTWYILPCDVPAIPGLRGLHNQLQKISVQAQFWRTLFYCIRYSSPHVLLIRSHTSVFSCSSTTTSTVVLQYLTRVAYFKNQ